MDERRTPAHEPGAETGTIDYGALFARAGTSGRHGRDDRFGELVAQAWLAAYAASTPWPPEVLEIPLGRLSYLFDAAPSLNGVAGEDRVVGVLGRSSRAAAPRDAGRMAGFVPEPRRWSGRGFDRGHLVSHAAGGGTDLNLFPQAAALNRGRTAAGRRWRAIEREVAAREGTFLFVRPLYADATWVPSELDAGFVRGDELVAERFVNR